MIEDIVTIEISRGEYKIPTPGFSFVELWNPKLSEILSLVPWLEANKKICYIWCYGFNDGTEYDYSPLFAEKTNRVVVPMWLGKTQDEAYELYSKAFKNLVSATIEVNNETI